MNRLTLLRSRSVFTLLLSGLLLVELLTVAARSALAQGRGNHAGIAGHGGFGQHVVGGSLFAGVRGGSGLHNPVIRNPGLRNLGSRNPRFHSSRFARRSFRRDPFLHNRVVHANRFHRFDPDRDGDNDDRDDFRFHVRHCFGFNCSGWVWGWPWWWNWGPWLSDSHTWYDQDQESNLVLANEMNQQSLEEQRQRRKEEQDSDARSDPQPQMRADADADPPAPSTVLVFRDQHRQEVQNYSIMSGFSFAGWSRAIKSARPAIGTGAQKQTRTLVAGTVSGISLLTRPAEDEEKLSPSMAGKSLGLVCGSSRSLVSVRNSTAKLRRSLRPDQVPRSECHAPETQCQSEFLEWSFGVTTSRGIERDYVCIG